MSGTARIQTKLIESARLAAPPAVLLGQWQETDTAATPVQRLLQNPALLFRVLEDLVQGTLAERLAQVDTSLFERQLRQDALKIALQDAAPNPAFQLRHWQLSRRLALTAAALAQGSKLADRAVAAATALLLRVGMLGLEQQQGAAYGVLTAGLWNQRALLAAERELFQTDHIEAGTQLLGRSQLDQFTIDALRYQALPLDQILDATPLVRLCWFANALCEQPAPEVLRATRELVALEPGQVQALQAEAQQQLTAECAARRFPLLIDATDAVVNAGVANEARAALQALRNEIAADTLLAQQAIDAGTDDPEATLARALATAGLKSAFLVLKGSHDTLRILASHALPAVPEDLRLVCAAGRNALSTLILQGDVGVLTRDTPSLSVIDRQLLDLLGGNKLVCECVRNGTDTTVLLLGHSGDPAAYTNNAALRRFVRHALATARAAAGMPASTLLLQQRIREAVHEANNPLAIIKNYLYILGMKQGGAEADGEFQLIRHEIDRIAAILAGLREVDPGNEPPRRVDLNKVLRGLHRMFASAFEADGKTLAIELDLAPEPVAVIGREGALKQILTNLVKNAAEAIESSGRVTLSTRSNVWLRDRFYVQLTVADDGPGIAPDLMARLFKSSAASPSATTKSGAHRGSGLGIVRRLVDDMGGVFSCRSNTGPTAKGTAMEILLPQA